MVAGRGSHVRAKLAEADGNRTRLPAFAASPVLKTGGPTRRPDASGQKNSCGQNSHRLTAQSGKSDNPDFEGCTAPPGGWKRSRRRRRAESGFLRQRESTHIAVGKTR